VILCIFILVYKEEDKLLYSRIALIVLDDLLHVIESKLEDIV